MRKVLIIDDSPADAGEIAAILTQHGYRVIQAESAEAGLKAASDEQPNLVLMDIVMPGINGFQATRQLTRGADTRHIPVILVSNKNDEIDRIWGARQGARGYVTKPIREAELLNVIRDVTH